MGYIIHGNLQDFIDYKRLIEYQASAVVYRINADMFRVTKVKKARNKRKKRHNMSVNTNRHKRLTNKRKVLVR